MSHQFQRFTYRDAIYLNIDHVMYSDTLFLKKLLKNTAQCF